ncbi:MAG TPA: hypothetical protein VGA02_06335 [Gemmatimonadales bacterium]
MLIAVVFLWLPLRIGMSANRFSSARPSALQADTPPSPSAPASSPARLTGPSIAALCDGQWHAVPGELRTSTPPAAIYIWQGQRTQFDHTIAVVARNADGGVFTQHYWLTPQRWTGDWTALDITTSEAPFTTMSEDGWEIIVAGTTPNNVRASRNVNTQAGWQGWRDVSLEQPRWGRPDITMEGDRRLWQFRRGPEDNVEYQCAPLSSAVPPDIEPHVLALYYAWYGTPTGPSRRWFHWDPTRTTFGAVHTPTLGHADSLGHYDSNDEWVLRQHIQWAQRAEIDGFVSSWWGQGGFEDVALRRLLAAAEEAGFAVCLLYESASPPTGQQVLADLRYIIERYGNHPAYLKVDGRPVIFVNWKIYNQQIFMREFASVAETLRAEGHPAFFIGDGLNMETGWFMDGIFGHGVTGKPPSDLESFYREGRRIADLYGRLFIGTVFPGFDDTIMQRQGRQADRLGGTLYGDVWRATLKAKPDWILINSFNQWHDGTEIEPSLQYGDQYLGLTTQFARTFKQLPAEPSASPFPPCQPPSGLAPMGIAHAEDGTVTLSWNPVEDPDLAHYNVRLDDGTTNRFDDPRYENCPAQSHYVCENGLTEPSLSGVPVEPGRTYSFWVDPIYSPPRNYCNDKASFTVAPAKP